MSANDPIADIREISSIVVKMIRAPFMLLCFSLLLGGCEPERGLKASRDVTERVDVGCVDQTLRQNFDEVERWDYVSDGGTFPKGTGVTQLAYYKSDDGEGWVTLHIASVSNKTRISHEFTGIGAKLPQTSFPPAMKAMADASAVIEKACGLHLSGMEWQEIGQDVEALH